MEALRAELTGWILAKTVTQCKRVAIYTGARETQISIIEHNMVGSEKGLY